MPWKILKHTFPHSRGLSPSRWRLSFAVIVILHREGAKILTKVNAPICLYVAQCRVYVQNRRARSSHVSSQSCNLCFGARPCTCILLFSGGWKYRVRTHSGAHCTSHIHTSHQYALPSVCRGGRKAGRESKPGSPSIPCHLLILAETRGFYREVPQGGARQHEPWSYLCLSAAKTLSSREARSGFNGKCGLQGPSLKPGGMFFLQGPCALVKPRLEAQSSSCFLLFYLKDTGCNPANSCCSPRTGHAGHIRKPEACS